MSNGNAATVGTDLVLPGQTGTVPAGSANFYQVYNAIWPDLTSGNALIAPPDNSMDRVTGKMISGWDGVEQRMEIMFATPFHQRVLRRWVGTFVPHILGESGVARVITRFFWAIATALDLWEPDYRIKQTFMMGDAINETTGPAGGSNTSVSQLFRQGQVIFRTEGMYYPRGHLGDFTPYQRASSGIVSRGGNIFDVVPVSTGTVG